MNITIAIHPDDYTAKGRSPGDDASSPRWKELIKSKGGTVQEVDVYSTDIIQQLSGANGFMWRWPHWGTDGLLARRLIPAVEQYLKIPVFPNLSTCWHYDDKVAQKLVLDACRLPTPKTWLFFRKEQAITWARSAAVYPLVMKLATGASSSNVRLIASATEAEEWVNRSFDYGLTGLNDVDLQGRAEEVIPASFRWRVAARAAIKGKLPAEWKRLRAQLQHGYVYFQEFLPNNEFDTRITVIGKRAFVFRRFNREDDFRASGSGKICYDQSQVDQAFVHLAFQAAEKLEMQSCAVDGLYDGGCHVIGEVSYTFASWAVHNCPGHWKRAENGTVSWVEGRVWPEEAQFEDFWAMVSTQCSAG